ncbi:acyl-coenzyme A thioesterase 13 [Cocos nucifera]|uniref:Acyl-coenzyme A thioesterase 13 n=1 Tax=Cocos nucifera TaxID=13894 RepID=A0A8K0N4T7_COCNU|nr:acyl-coenzyme A thioesterase 13 [Cocos nucifera]
MAEEQQKLSYVANTEGFFRRLGLFKESLPEACEKKDFYSDLVGSLLKADRIERGRITCSLSVNSAVTNLYNTLHGGVVAAVAEAVALACVRTVAGDKELFLGEFSTSYLSAARLDEEVEVDGCMLRQGRSVAVTSVELRIKKTRKLLYISRATFYIMPVASL